jgi:hypothetical protein
MLNSPEISIFPILIGNSYQSWHKLCASPKRSILMNIRNFVGASSAILLAWLGATYFHEVPPERYPKLDRTLGSSSAKPLVSDEAIAGLAASDL